MTEVPRYSGYDVLAKRDSASWNDRTRQVIDKRLATAPGQRRFLSKGEWRALDAVCARIIPQPADRAEPVPLAAMVDEKLAEGGHDGYRDARLPPTPEAWRRGLAALDAEAQGRHRRVFSDLPGAAQDSLLTAVQRGLAQHPAWGDMPPALFFSHRLLTDIVAAYYAHPVAWSEIGFGGPASPRGYVRMDYDQRDPWEAAEAKPGREDQARRENARVGRR